MDFERYKVHCRSVHTINFSHLTRQGKVPCNICMELLENCKGVRIVAKGTKTRTLYLVHSSTEDSNCYCNKGDKFHTLTQKDGAYQWEGVEGVIGIWKISLAKIN